MVVDYQLNKFAKEQFTIVTSYIEWNPRNRRRRKSGRSFFWGCWASSHQSLSLNLENEIEAEAAEAAEAKLGGKNPDEINLSLKLVRLKKILIRKLFFPTASPDENEKYIGLEVKG